MQPPDDLDIAPARQRSGCAMKWFALLGILGGLSLVVCCGACGFFFYTIMPRPLQTAGDINAVTAEIIDVTIPADFTPQTGMKADNWLFAARMTIYRQKEGRGMLMFQEVIGKMGDKDAMATQFKQQLNQQPDATELKVLKIEKSEPREFTIRGETVTFTFAEGEDVSSSTHYHQVTGDFPGKNGPASLTLQLEDSAWDEEEVVQMLNSMK